MHMNYMKMFLRYCLLSIILLTLNAMHAKEKSNVKQYCKATMSTCLAPTNNKVHTLVIIGCVVSAYFFTCYIATRLIGIAAFLLAASVVKHTLLSQTPATDWKSIIDGIYSDVKHAKTNILLHGTSMQTYFNNEVQPQLKHMTQKIKTRVMSVMVDK